MILTTSTSLVITDDLPESITDFANSQVKLRDIQYDCLYMTSLRLLNNDCQYDQP